MADDDDRSRDASSAAEPSWADVVIPDDIRELAHDVADYHRDQRRAARAARLGRFTASPAALPFTIVGAAVVIAGVILTLLTVLAPSTETAPPVASPLAAPSAPVGEVGGLLPEATLQQVDAGPTDSSVIRPAAIALVPPHCGCAPLITAIAAHAFGVNLGLDVVVPGFSDADADALPATISHYTVTTYDDSNATLAGALRPRGVTVVLVRPDGVISAVRRSVTTDTVTQLDAPLQGLLLAIRSAG